MCARFGESGANKGNINVSITIKFGQVDKDTPSLNVMDSRFPVAGHSPLLRAKSAPSEVPYQVKFPQWFRQNQQQQVTQEVARRFNDLQLQWSRMDIPQDDILWASKSVLNENPQDISIVAGKDAALNSYNVNITWPASSDKIVSKPLNPEAAVNLPSGNHQLKLTVDGQEYNLSVAVSQNYGQVDSHKDVLQRLAISINSQQPKIKAKLEENVNPSDPMAPYHMPGRSLTLSLQGHAQDFYLQDIEGELAATYGLDRNQPGGPAVAQVNGAYQQAQGNLLPINDLVGIITDPSNGQFKVQVAKGPGPLVNSLHQFLTSYNELVDYMALNSDYLRASLSDRLTRPQQQMAAKLEEIGLATDRQGHITPKSSFNQHLLGDYAKTRQILLQGDEAWAPAFMEQMNSIMDISLENYTSPLLTHSEEQVRSRAWLELDSLRQKIINAYY